MKLKISLVKYFNPDCAGCNYYRQDETSTDRGMKISYSCDIPDVNECPEAERELEEIIRSLDSDLDLSDSEITDED